MKRVAWTAFLLTASISCYAQTSTKWVRAQYVDVASGDLVTTFRLDAQPDMAGARKPYLLISCDPHSKRYSGSYYTDIGVSVDKKHRGSDGEFIAVDLEFSGETTGPKRERTDTEPDFKTIQLDRSVLEAISTQPQVVLRFPSASGSMIMDTFNTRDFPFDQYSSDCFPPPRLLRRSSQ
jgi:hypothetical protein